MTRQSPHALHFRLHVPAHLNGATQVPLLVALHGCTQNANDFAEGTRFDKLADRYGAIVVYPEQPERANPRRCWNWFLPENQSRQRGEPAAILAIVEDVIERLNVDRSRVFVTGMSAGAAMAAILAEQAPDVFAAVGLVAGIALHVSHDIRTAYSAMRGDLDPDAVVPMLQQGDADAYRRMRAIIWAGARDRTVAPANAQLLAVQFRQLLHLSEDRNEQTVLADGLLSQWRDEHDTTRVVLRTIEELGHAWSGGSLRGSHTAPKGPSASEALMRFFLGDAPILRESGSE